jgi:N-acetylglucosamine malate deacetylase 1
MNKVAIIAPHMDDEVLGCGGTIAKHIDKGDEVFVIIIAKRAYDHKFDEELINQEKKSAVAAQKILGYQRLFFLDLRDEQLDHKLIDIVVPLEESLKKIKPDIVYTCNQNDINQDHQAVYKASMIACRPQGSFFIKKLYSYEVPSATDQIPAITSAPFIKSKYVNIEEYIKKKIEAMQAYENESREYPHPRSPDGICIYAKKRGIEVGYKYAESFQLLRELDD